jgi:geranylgeranyl pyrophosphate synthase
MLGGGRLGEVEALSEFGRRIGFISRLANEVEDCLNVTGDLGHRILYESVPLPLLYAAKSSVEEYAKIKKIVEKKYFGQSDVRSLLESCFNTEAFEFIRSLAKKNEDEAIKKLRLLKTSEARDVLLLLINSAYDRVASLCI